MSRFSRWSHGEQRLPKGGSFAAFRKLNEAPDQPGSNPTGPGSVETPTQKAERMGLTSDGHGSFMDQSGKIVARIVNGELVFYDGGANGGAATDGEGGGAEQGGGGAEAAQTPTPTFTDPETGMVKIPSARPESPEEMAAVPDPVPAVAPRDFGKFVQQKADIDQAANQAVADAGEGESVVDPNKVDALAQAMAGGEWDTMDPAQREALQKQATAKLQDLALKQVAAEPQPDVEPDQPSPEEARAAEAELQATSDEPTPEQEKINTAMAASAEKAGPAQTGYDGPAPEGTEKLVTDLVGDITDKLANKKTGKLPGYAQKMVDKLQDPVARKQFGEYLEFTQREEQKIADRWDELSQVSDAESAKRLMTEGMGMVTNEKGQLEFRPVEPGMREFMSLAKSNTEKGYRGLQFRELVELAKPEVQARLNDPDRQKINAESIVNPDVSWEMATELYDQLSPSAKNAFNKLGGADAMREAFDPKVPVYYLKDSQGNATGLTNIDVMAKSDPEMYSQQFEKTGGRNRGIFLLQKMLATGGKDQITGLPNFLTPQSGTVDHLEGRSQEMADKSIRKDSPVNMGLVSNSVNWAKADAADNEGNKDTIPGLSNVANSYSSGSINGYGKKLGGGDDNMYNTWLSQRIGGIDIRDSKAAQTTQTEPDDLASFMTSPVGKAGGVVNRLADSGAIGYDIRNMSMYYPRDDHDTKYDQNSWSGNPRKGSNRGYYTTLDGWRKSVLGGAVYGSAINDAVESHREALEAKKMAPAKIDEELKKYKKNYVKYHFSMPMRAIASAWTMGLISRQEYIDNLRGLSDKAIGMVKDTHPDHVEQLTQERDASLDKYLEEINTHQGEDELNNVSEEWLMKNISANPVVNVLYSQMGREIMAQKHPKVLEAFDAAVADGTIASKSLAVGKGKGNEKRLVDPSKGTYYEDWRSTLGTEEEVFPETGISLDGFISRKRRA